MPELNDFKKMTLVAIGGYHVSEGREYEFGIFQSNEDYFKFSFEDGVAAKVEQVKPFPTPSPIVQDNKGNSWVIV